MALNFPGFGDYQQPPRRPQRQPRQRQPLSQKQKKHLKNTGITVAVLVALFVIIPPLVSVYTGWLWFDSLEKGGIFGTILGTRLGIFLIVGVVSAAIIYFAMAFAHRAKPTTLSRPNPVLDPYRRIGEGKHKPVFITVAVIVGIVFGFSLQLKWQQISIFFHSTSFGVKDPQFNHDLSFYAFQLPFLTILFGWLIGVASIGIVLNILPVSYTHLTLPTKA
mgnify:FL=1